MVWSRTTLTPYDFSDLQITGEFDNRPDIERFLRIFSCVVKYRPASVYDNVGRLYMNATHFQVQCYTLISKFAIISPKKQVVKISLRISL